MPENESMTVDERYKYLRILHPRYAGADRATRTRLLDEAAQVTGLNRKYLCHLLNRPGPIRRPRLRQRGPHYSGQVLHAVAVVAEALDWICAERLQPALAQTAVHLARFGALDLTPRLQEELEALSVSTVSRMLKRLRQDQPRLPQRRGRASTGLTAQIPAGRLPWNLTAPGYFELDLVHHCGPETRADYVCTLQWIDVATGWSERVAVLGRSHRAMIQAFDQVVSRCPFPIRAIHPDNGSEFLNHPLLAHFGQRVQGVQVTRSRPWQKNDNRFVEQKNATLVRALLGDLRLTTLAQCRLLNQIYTASWVYYNLFQPVLRQTAKTYTQTPAGAPRVHRGHDVAASPYARLVRSGALSPQATEDLAAIYDVTNPLALRREIRSQLAQLYALAQHPTREEEGMG